MNVIDGQNIPAVGNIFDWITTAAGNVSKTVKTVEPVYQQVKDTFGNNTGVVSPVYQQQINPNQSISTWQQQQVQQPASSNNTLLYVGLGAAAILAIILLNKK